MDIKDYKKYTRLGLIVFLVLAIPLTIFLVRQTQIFQPKANVVPTMDFITSQGGTVLSGNPPQTNHQNDNWVRLSWSSNNQCSNNSDCSNGLVCQSGQCVNTNPGSSSTPTQSTVPNGNTSLTVNPTGIHLGDTVSVSWSNAPTSNAVKFYLRADNLPAAGVAPFIGSPSFLVAIPTCVLQPGSADFAPASNSFSSGNCSFVLDPAKLDTLTLARFQSYTQTTPFVFSLVIQPIGSFDGNVVATTNVNFLPSVTSTNTGNGGGGSASFSCSNVTACMADLNADGTVDNDISNFYSDGTIASNCLNLFGPQTQATLDTNTSFIQAFAPTCRKMDFNGDNKIDSSEVNCIVSKVGQSC